MIPINRPPTVPQILLTRGVTERATLCADFDRDPAPFRTGKKPAFDSTIYAAPSVKDALLRMQHGKCAFCESKVEHVGYGDVEHYRPKAGYRQTPRGPLKRPGYFWLVYEWENLLFSCQLCNQRFKRNHFPLRDGRRRIRAHRTSVANEGPLLINPAVTDPRQHITFLDEAVVPVGPSAEGQATIDGLGLNRPKLREYRREYLDFVRDYRDARDALREADRTGGLSANGRQTLARLNARLMALQEPTAEYAAMTRALLR